MHYLCCGRGDTDAFAPMNLSFTIAKKYGLSRELWCSVLIVLSFLSVVGIVPLAALFAARYMFKSPVAAKVLLALVTGFGLLSMLGFLLFTLDAWSFIQMDVLESVPNGVKVLLEMAGIGLLSAAFAMRLYLASTVNAIHIINAIAATGIGIGTAALILVMSVFNGFGDLISQLFSNFNPDVKIVPAQGKTFESDTLLSARLRGLKAVLYLSETFEEVAFFEYEGSQDFGTIKGVDDQFRLVNGIDTTLREGVYKLQEGEVYYAVLGGGMRNKLSVNVDNDLTPMRVYMPRRTQSLGTMDAPFTTRLVYPAGTFVIQQDFDNQYVLTSLEMVENLLGRPGFRSAYEIRLRPGADHAASLAEIRAIVGSDFAVKDRYRQDEAFLKLMNIEKWMSFAILSLTLVLVAFNIIGCLWMIVLEKRGDIAVLRSIGAHTPLIRNIFIETGLLLCATGMAIGVVAALNIYLLQKTYGILPIPEGFVVNSYPMSLRGSDFLAIAGVIALIGILASLPAALKAIQVPAVFREV